MYNNNYYQNSNSYYSYYATQPYTSNNNYNYNFSSYSADKTIYQGTNKINKIIKLYPITQTQNNQYYYNYLSKTPIQTPIKYSLINNNYQQTKLISKSPEPYIRYYNKNESNNSHIINLNINVKQNNYPENTRINNIQRVNKIIKITPYKYMNNNMYHARTPEPNLRGRNKLKQKRAKMKINNNFAAKTFIPLNMNYINYNYNNQYSNENIVKNTYDVGYVNKTDYLNISKNNYINSINNIIPHKVNYANINIQNNNINNYSKINYYPVKNNYNYNQYNQYSITSSNKKNGINYIVNLNSNKNNFVKNRLRSFNLHVHHYSNHPKGDFNTAEFILINSIGEGSFGKIYCVQWIKNNKLYAMKKLDIQTLEELNEFKEKVKIVKDLYKNTRNSGFIKLYADKVVPLYNQQICYNYYIIMELGDRDWEKEIQLRLLHQQYYTEYELYHIISQLVKTLSLMQLHNVSHRDIKPANVLIMKGVYKICDFGEATIINGNGVVIHNVRGSQLFMSPILFYAYNHNITQVMHNTYKSDVYSFGMCILLAASLSGYTLYDIREILNIKEVSKIIINKLRNRYSMNFINLLLQMLQIDENLRMDFVQLENYILSIYKY